MNLWNIKNLSIPPINTYKAENANIDIKHLAKVFRDGKKYFDKEHYMMAEYKIMTIIIYRTKQKFRSSKDFKALEKIYKALGNYFKINISRDLKSFIKLIPNRYTDETYLPNKSVLDYILVRLQGMAKLLERIVELCKVTADLFDARLRTGHFWKLGFIVFSLVSRIYVLAKYGAKFICKFYNKVVPFSHQLRNNGRNWLPKNYVLPTDLQKWLNVNWLDIDDEIQIIETPEFPDITQFFDLVDDEDDVQICDEYIMIGDDATEVTNEFKKLEDVKTSIRKMRGFDMEEDIGEIIEVNDDSLLREENTVLQKDASGSEKLSQTEIEENGEPDFGEVIEVADSLHENTFRQTCNRSDASELIVIDNSLSTLDKSCDDTIELSDSSQIVDENSLSDLDEVECLGSSTPLTKGLLSRTKIIDINSDVIVLPDTPVISKANSKCETKKNKMLKSNFKTASGKSASLQNDFISLSNGDVTLTNLSQENKNKITKKRSLNKSQITVSKNGKQGKLSKLKKKIHSLLKEHSSNITSLKNHEETVIDISDLNSLHECGNNNKMKKKKVKNKSNMLTLLHENENSKIKKKKFKNKNREMNNNLGKKGGNSNTAKSHQLPSTIVKELCNTTKKKKKRNKKQKQNSHNDSDINNAADLKHQNQTHNASPNRKRKLEDVGIESSCKKVKKFKTLSTQVSPKTKLITKEHTNSFKHKRNKVKLTNNLKTKNHSLKKKKNRYFTMNLD